MKNMLLGQRWQFETDCCPCVRARISNITVVAISSRMAARPPEVTAPMTTMTVAVATADDEWDFKVQSCRRKSLQLFHPEIDSVTPKTLSRSEDECTCPTCSTNEYPIICPFGKLNNFAQVKWKSRYPEVRITYNNNRSSIPIQMYSVRRLTCSKLVAWSK